MNFLHGNKSMINIFDISIYNQINESNFLKGNINKKATVELIRRIFPRFLYLINIC